LYDWADSAFALCVLSAFFPILLKNYYLPPELSAFSTTKLGFANGISGFTAALLCPIFAAIIAQKDTRKNALTIFSILGAAATILLYFVQTGQHFFALLLFIVANIFYRLSIMCHDSLLPAVALPKNRHRVSAIGFSAGYLGCGLVFAVNIFMVSNPSAFGISNSLDASKISILTAGLWWIIFASPLYFAKIHANPRLNNKEKSFVHSFISDLKETFVFAWKSPQIRFFLIAYWFYIDGVHSFVMMAVDYGLSLNFSPKTLMISLLCVQITAFPFAILAGLSANKFGAKKILLISILIYVLITLGAAWIIKKEWQFTLFAIMTGLVQGGIQSVSRSYFSLIIPKDKDTELFGLFNTLGRFAVAAGPILIAGSIILSQKMGFTGNIPQRIGISSLILPFAIGFFLLCKVRSDS
jgi:UMF1 family MFS transporter